MLQSVLRLGVNWMLAALLISGASSARAGDQVPVGPRALGMGGAFTSISDDASALFWNPAGLSQLQRQEIAGTHANLFQTGTKDDYIAFVLPLSPSICAAADWYHSGFNDGELGFGENRLDLASGVKIRNLLSVGATIKYVTRSIDLDESTVREGTGFGADLGLLVKPGLGVTVGVVGHDIFNTSLRYRGEGTSIVYRRSVRAGASYALSRLGTLAVDIDDRYHFGAELTPLKEVALRAGVEDDLEGSERITATYGVGLRLGGFRFDYALVDHPFLGSTSHFGLSVAFSFNPARVKIEKLETEPLYLSLHRSYAHEPFGTVRLHNLEDRTLMVRASVYVPDLMASATEQELVLRPGAVQDFPLTAVLSDRVMDQRSDRVAPIHVSVTYQSQHLMRTERKIGSLIAHAPGAINWTGGVGQAAAFVTTRDPIVDSFARDAIRSVLYMETDLFGNRNIRFAAAIIDALGALGVAYVPDPNQPYSRVQESANAIDTVQYPRQTLDRRTGDCDDTSVLVASMLGSLGVRSKFVDVPGHLFLLASTGVHERNRVSLGLSEDLFVVSGGEVWIPLETTLLHQGFAEAWRAGAEEYENRSARDRLTLFDVAENQSRYEPAEPRGITIATPSVDMTDLGGRVNRDARTIDSWRRAYVTARYGEAQRISMTATPAALNQLAHVYFTTGRSADSRQRLEMLLTREPGSARARNNLAMTDVIQGDLQGALRNLGAAITADSSDAGVWLNLGLTHYLAGDTLRAKADFSRGLSLAGGLTPAAKLMGIRAPEASAVEGGNNRDALVRSLLLSVRGEISARAAGSTSEQLTGPGKPAGSGEKLGQWSESGAATVREMLYWKE